MADWFNRNVQTGMFRTAFMRGWDAAVIYLPRRDNPYYRHDSRQAWETGYNWCEQGRDLPRWYDEWRHSRAGRRVSACGHV